MKKEPLKAAKIESKTIDQYYSYYTYVCSKCKKGQYNLFLHRHLGDSLVLLGLKDIFEEKYQAPIHYIVQENQEVLAKMYGVTNYTTVDFSSLMDEPHLDWEFTPFELDKFKENLCERLFPSVPQLDLPFIASPTEWVKTRLGWENFVDGWAKMLGLKAKKLPVPRNIPELSDGFSRELKAIGALDKIVLLAPEAQSFMSADESFWPNLARKIQKKGYIVVTNAINKNNMIEGTHNLKMSVSDLIALGYRCHSIHSLRSGLCDCLVGRQEALTVYYTPEMLFKYLSLNECFILDKPVNEVVISTVAKEVKRPVKKLLRIDKLQAKKKLREWFYIPVKAPITISADDISVVVQGAVAGEATRKCLDSIRKYLPGAEVILSTWQGADITGLDFDVLVLNEDPGAKYFNIGYSIWNNCNRQIVSTRAGMERATRKYILKFRTDFILESNEFLRYWDVYPKRRGEYALFSHRVLTDVLFSRFRSDVTGRPTPFHISDLWMFGLAEDVKDYFSHAELLTDDELGEYTCLYPERIPYPEMTFRYAPEQYFCYTFVKSKVPELQFRDWSDWNEENAALYDNIAFNNFVFLSFEQSGIWSDKHGWTLINENEIYGVINHYYFQDRYRYFCDHGYIPRKLRWAENNPLYELLRFLKDSVLRVYWFIYRIIEYFVALFRLTFRFVRSCFWKMKTGIGHRVVLRKMK